MGRSLTALNREAAGHRNFMDSVSEFFGQDATSVIKTRQPELDGTYKQTWGDKIWNRDPSELQYQGEKNRQDILRKGDDFTALNALDPTSKVDHTTNDATVGLALQDAKDLKTVKTEAASVGVPASDLVGVTDVGTVQGLTRAKKVKNAAEAYKSSPQGLRAAREEERLIRSDLETKAARQDQLAESAKDRQQTLRLKQMSMDADKARYEQERAYYEQDKRSDSIAALVAGLASLGGAFAL